MIRIANPKGLPYRHIIVFIVFLAGLFALAASTGVVYAAPAADASAGDNSVYAGETIPDGTVMIPSESFNKVWKFHNTGSTKWTTGYSIMFVSGNSMSGMRTYLTAEVAKDGYINVTVPMQAPISTGSYTGYWQLADANGKLFGEMVWVMISAMKNKATEVPAVTPDCKTNGDLSFDATKICWDNSMRLMVKGTTTYGGKTSRTPVSFETQYWGTVTGGLVGWQYCWSNMYSCYWVYWFNKD